MLWESFASTTSAPAFGEASLSTKCEKKYCKCAMYTKMKRTCTVTQSDTLFLRGEGGNFPASPNGTIL